MYLIGFELSDETITASLLDASNNKLISEVKYPDTRMDVMSRRSGWAEQQPEVWWQNLCFASRKLLSTSGIASDDIQGIGISYQMHGLVMIDSDQQILRPSIIWSDSRASTIGDHAFKDLGENFCLQNYLNSPGNFTASKLKWVKDNEPDIYARIHKVMLPGDFIAMRLTGMATTTISGLSECILWNYHRKSLATDLLEYYGIDENLICDLVPTFGVQGYLSKLAADFTGLKAGTPVTYRAGDQPTNALSVNVLNPGEIAASSGSSGVVYGIVDEPTHDVKSRVNAFTHVNYEDNFNRIGVLLCLNGGGIQYSWLKRQIARTENSFEDMERMASTVQVGSDGLGVLPFGNGAERIFENRNIKSHLFNIQFHRHTRSHIYRATLEGLAFSFFYGVNHLKELGIDVSVIRAEKDLLFKSEVFSQTLGTLLGCQIEVVETSGALGAARGAGVGCGVYKSIEEAVEGVKPTMVFEPEYNQTDCLQAYNFWRSTLDLLVDNQGISDASEQNYKSRFMQVEKELNTKSGELARSSMQLESKNDFLRNLQGGLSNIIKANKMDTNQLLKMVSRIEQHLSENKDWQVVEENFNLIHDDFFQKLKHQYPKLSTQDAKLCALLKLKMSTKEIASQLNLSVRGVETKRYRLRKKLLGDRQFNLTHFLDAL